MKNKPIYNVSIILSDWYDCRTYLDKYYFSKEKAERVRGKFERIKEKYLKYYQSKSIEHEHSIEESDLILWGHHHKRVEFLKSDVSIIEITVE